MVRGGGLKSATSVIALCWAASAAAQETAVPDREGSEEVVVTAQKREQRLVDVPAAVTVLSGSQMEERGIESIQDLSFNVPGLTMREDGPGSYTVFLRGLANQSGSGALVSIYLDEAPMSLSGFDQLSPVALDLARVEVLKGPQGTLYGQGSAGGTIRYVTNDPNLTEVEGRIEAELYGVEHGEIGTKLTGVVSVPLIEDELAIRLAGAWEQGGGWIDQPEAGIKDGNGTRLLNFRGKLLWTPTAEFSAEAMIQVHRADTKLGMGFEEPDRTVDIGPDRSKVMIPKEFDFTVYNLELRYDFGFAEIVSATTYIEHWHQYPFTYIPRPGNFSYGFVEGNDDRWGDSDQFSQEIRLQSGDGPFQWTIGGYYSEGSGYLSADYEYLFAPAGDLYTGGGFFYDDLYFLSVGDSQSFSIFADASYDFTDRFTLGAGIRYFEEDASSLIEYAPGAGVVQSATFDSVDPRVYLSYRYGENAQVYASYAKGFRSGGFNAAPFAPYDPEKVYTYEIGTKGVLADGAFSFDVAAFFTSYEDMVRRRLVLEGGAYLQESSNIGKVEVRGVEGGFSWRPIDPLTLTVSVAYLDSEIVETDAADEVNNPGDPTDYTPKWSYTLSANYEFNWAAGVPGFARLDYAYRDKVTYIDRSSFDEAVLPQMSDSFGLLNARIGASVGDVDVEIYGANLTDENKAIDPYQGWANSNRTRPRVIGVMLGYSF